MKTATTEAARLVAEFRARGLYLEPRGHDRLRVGPPELLDPGTVERAREAKTALLRILTSDRIWTCVRCDRFRFRQPTICYWCRRVIALEVET